MQNTEVIYQQVKVLRDHTVLTENIKQYLSFFDESYFEFISIYSGAEGWVGCDYVKFWDVDDLIKLNTEYKVSDYIPYIFLFGSDRGGNAFGINRENKEIIKLPFIPFDVEFIEKTYKSFDEFINCLERNELNNKNHYSINPDTFNKEIFEKHPIVLGGDPSDKTNKVLIDEKEHVKAVVFFNEVVKKVRNGNA